LVLGGKLPPVLGGVPVSPKKIILNVGAFEKKLSISKNLDYANTNVVRLNPRNLEAIHRINDLSQIASRISWFLPTKKNERPIEKSHLIG